MDFGGYLDLAQGNQGFRANFREVPTFCIGDQNLELSHLLTKISPSSEGVTSKTRYLDTHTPRILA